MTVSGRVIFGMAKELTICYLVKSKLRVIGIKEYSMDLLRSFIIMEIGL